MTPLILVLSLFLLGVQALHGSQWTYSEGTLDEEHWSSEYPTCGKKKQSPINVQRSKVQYNPNLKPLILVGYEAQNAPFTMINNGHTVQISLYHTMHMIVPDGTRYIAQQMHFHWGDASSEISGSEHTIDGTRYVAEAHLVHYNSKYHSFEEAQNAPDGLAVLAFFLKIQEYSENLYYSSFISHLNSIKYPGQSTVIEGLNIMDMMPHNPQHYYTYTGSLTTPPCTQDISWFLLADAVLISITQARNLESTLQDHSNKTLQNNYRTTQPLHNRVVESNFKILFNQHSEYPVLNGIYNKLKTLRKLEKQKKEKGQEKKEKSSKERKSKVKHN